MFRSATFKLTLYYIAIVMILSILFSTIIYRMATLEIASSLHHEASRIFKISPDFFSLYMRTLNDEIEYRSHHLLLRLFSLNIAVLIAAGLASFFLARRTLRPIEVAHERQKRFTADVSHELRTPLTALRMESEVALLGTKSTATELKATLKSNLEEVTKLENLINNLLRLSSLEADELQQNFIAVPLKSVVASATETIRTLASERKVTIENHVTTGTVLGDANSLEQLLLILLDNAVKYSPSKATITVQSRTDGDVVIVEIIDQGKGIEPEALQRIFDRFYRADSARTKDASHGFGLGLSIAKMITTVHGGTIEITSQLGAGTTVTLRLPKP